MIDPDTIAFPNNIVAEIAPRIALVDPDINVVMRTLRPTDPNLSVGVFATSWIPEDDSHEMGNREGEPTLGNYEIVIQTFTKAGDADTGIAVSSVFMRKVRMVLYRDATLRVALSALNVLDEYGKESMRKWKVNNCRYMSNDIDGAFVFVSTMELHFETEMS